MITLIITALPVIEWDNVGNGEFQEVTIPGFQSRGWKSKPLHVPGKGEFQMFSKSFSADVPQQALLRDLQLQKIPLRLERVENVVMEALVNFSSPHENIVKNLTLDGEWRYQLMKTCLSDRILLSLSLNSEEEFPGYLFRDLCDWMLGEVVRCKNLNEVLGMLVETMGHNHPMMRPIREKLELAMMM
jgi:hypothetical protein